MRYGYGESGPPLVLSEPRVTTFLRARLSIQIAVLEGYRKLGWFKQPQNILN